MVMVRLGYEPKSVYKWKELDEKFKDSDSYNGKLIVTINLELWKKIKNVMYLKHKGYDSIILLDGKRRTGKSTLAMTIAYLLNPSITINNYIAGMGEAFDKIANAKNEDVLIFDEGSLVASSKDAMTKLNKQLEKVIDVVGQKKLTLLFCMPEFYKISNSLATVHSLFLIHVYTDENLNRGRFAYFGTSRKKGLYYHAKKNFGSYDKPKSDFTGLFNDFHLPFEEEYFKLKLQSLKEALTINQKQKEIPKEVINKIRTETILAIKKIKPELNFEFFANALGIKPKTLRETIRRYKKRIEEKNENGT